MLVWLRQRHEQEWPDTGMITLDAVTVRSPDGAEGDVAAVAAAREKARKLREKNGTGSVLQEIRLSVVI